MVKMKTKKITFKYIERAKNNYINKGYNPPKWLQFCEIMLKDNWKIYLYEAKTTVSKYIFIQKDNQEYKIRFSNHKSNFKKETNNDCDFYVGVGNFRVITTEQLIKQLQKVK